LFFNLPRKEKRKEKTSLRRNLRKAKRKEIPQRNNLPASNEVFT